MSIVIIENGDQLDVTPAEFELLKAAGLAYMCPECGEDIAHLRDEFAMDEACALLESGHAS